MFMSRTALHIENLLSSLQQPKFCVISQIISSSQVFLIMGFVLGRFRTATLFFLFLLIFYTLTWSRNIKALKALSYKTLLSQVLSLLYCFFVMIKNKIFFSLKVVFIIRFLFQINESNKVNCD